MKEKIKEKLEENIERILSKEELTKADVDILQLKLCEIENEENASKRAEKNHSHKLTEEQVKEIYLSDLKISELAKIYNVSKTNITYIKTKKQWSWLTNNLD